MPEPRFDNFIFDGENEAKFEEHGLTSAQVATVLYGYDFQVRRNRNDRVARYLLIGRDSSGICVSVPVQETDEQGTWRPVTAWPCKPAEERQL